MKRAKKHTEVPATGSARVGARDRRIKVPSPCMESWNSNLQSALVLIQEIDFGTQNGDLSAFTFSSLLDGAHALIERVAEDINDWGAP